MDIAKYFGKSTNEKLGGRALNISIQGSSPSSVLSAARELNRLQKRQVLPENIKKEITCYAWKYISPETRRWASKCAHK